MTREDSAYPGTTTFRRPGRLLRLVFRVDDKVDALLGRPGPRHWLTITVGDHGSLHSVSVTVHEVDGKTYVIDVFPLAGRTDIRWVHRRDRKLPRRGWDGDARAFGRGTRTTGRADAEVTITEVTDPAVRRRVLTLLEEPVPDGLTGAVSRVAVFEITPA